MGIDATAPFARREAFLRKVVSGVDDVDLDAYFGG